MRIPNMGDHVWFITSRQTEPLLSNRPGQPIRHLQDGMVYGQLVNVRVEDLVHESDAGGLEGVLLGELDVDLPHAAGEGRWDQVVNDLMD